VAHGRTLTISMTKSRQVTYYYYVASLIYAANAAIEAAELRTRCNPGWLFWPPIRQTIQ
jgi:predicted  nucleic acid-binding Zn ribbon protein